MSSTLAEALELHRASWHSFRHAHATVLAQVGETLKTVQAIFGHSDFETTLNTYVHAIPDSQRRAVERVADVYSQDLLQDHQNLEKPASLIPNA